MTKVPEIDTVTPPPLGHAPSIPGVSRGGGQFWEKNRDKNSMHSLWHQWGKRETEEEKV